MLPPLYYIGTPAEIEHHARPLAEAFDLRIVSEDEVVRLARPGELCVFFNEYFPRFRDACIELKAKGCATLYAIDGILEWRNSWELPEYSDSCLWVMRPALSHKVACIGRSQARVLESWGNLGKCEVVGVPRFDRLAGRQPRSRRPDEPFRVLVITAKCPGFNPRQIACTTESLRDLKSWFDSNPSVEGVKLEPMWRLTSGLETEIGVENRLRDTTGQDLATTLASVDAVISTPSTAMLEGMLQGLPVAILDFHNRPHYVPAAWRITAKSQIGPVLAELANPLPARMLYQASILHDALECHAPATPRLVELALQMQGIARECIQAGKPLTFPRRILADAQLGHHLPERTYDHQRLFPQRMLQTGTGRRLSMAESIEAVAREGLSLAVQDPLPPEEAFSQANCSEQLNIPRNAAYGWHHLAEQLDADREHAIRRATAPLERALRRARREVEALRRQTLRARLERLEDKVRRCFRLQPRSQSPADCERKVA